MNTPDKSTYSSPSDRIASQPDMEGQENKSMRNRVPQYQSGITGGQVKRCPQRGRHWYGPRFAQMGYDGPI